MTDVAFIALGSNQGDRESHLAFGCARIARLPTTRMLAMTSVEETPPLGGLEQEPYLNQMVAVETGLAPRALLGHLHAIESERGRVRGARWAPRTLDLDLVQYDDLASADTDLILPHPGLTDRDFWQREVLRLGELLRGRP
jgi:2-amino-4-hydroxy-6-hydroxymethyldihydropteridine diphosphokinase